MGVVLAVANAGQYKCNFVSGDRNGGVVHVRGGGLDYCIDNCIRYKERWGNNINGVQKIVGGRDRGCYCIENMISVIEGQNRKRSYKRPSAKSYKKPSAKSYNKFFNEFYNKKGSKT